MYNFQCVKIDYYEIKLIIKYITILHLYYIANSESENLFDEITKMLWIDLKLIQLFRDWFDDFRADFEAKTFFKIQQWSEKPRSD